jgi:hypothetical protein
MNFSLQEALYANLKEYTALTALIGERLYDNVPQTTPFPYVSIGDLRFEDNSQKGAYGNFVTVPIHVWSNHRGKKECQQIMRLIYLRWHDLGVLAVSGMQFTGMYHTYSTIITEPDGLTRHGASNYRVTISEI